MTGVRIAREKVDGSRQFGVKLVAGCSPRDAGELPVPALPPCPARATSLGISLRSPTVCRRSRHPGRAHVVSPYAIAVQLSNDDPCQVLESRRHPRPIKAPPQIASRAEHSCPLSRRPPERRLLVEICSSVEPTSIPPVALSGGPRTRRAHMPAMNFPAAGQTGQVGRKLLVVTRSGSEARSGASRGSLD